jgi:hypothetical protein
MAYSNETATLTYSMQYSGPAYLRTWTRQEVWTESWGSFLGGNATIDWNEHVRSSALSPVRSAAKIKGTVMKFENII